MFLPILRGSSLEHLGSPNTDLIGPGDSALSQRHQNEAFIRERYIKNAHGCPFSHPQRRFYHGSRALAAVAKMKFIGCCGW
jgi:hypothetical protein